MKIENQVCTLEQAKRLKELGIIQQSHFCWFNRWSQFKLYYNRLLDALEQPERVFSAYSVAELSEMLPVELEGYFSGFDATNQQYADGGNYYTICYKCVPGASIKNIYLYKDSFAESLAAMLIHLLETGKATAEECNQRLMQA